MDLDWAYIAGFFDGEGTCGIYGRENGNGTQIKVCITQQKREVLDWIREVTQLGKVYPRYGEGALGGPCHVWLINDRVGQETFLRAILPYLKVKKLAAEAVLLGLEKKREHLRKYSPLRYEQTYGSLRKVS